MSLGALSLAALAVVGCGQPAGPAAPKRAHAAPPIDPSLPAAYRFIPADTPYLYASQSLPNVQRGTASDLWTIAVNEFKSSLAKGGAGAPSPGVQAMLSLLAEVEADTAHSWTAHFGLADNFHYVLYGLSAWPVVRVELRDPARMRGVLDRLWAAAGVHVQPTRSGTATYWSFTRHDDAVFVIVTDRELIAAVVSGPLAAQALPYLLGTKLPDASLAQAVPTPELARLRRNGKHGEGFIDLRRIADIVLGRAAGLNATLRGSATMDLTPACLAEVDRLVGFMPRLLWSVSRFDDQGTTWRMIAEIPPAQRSSLRALRTSFGGIELAEVAQSAIALGGAVDLDGLLGWAHDGVSALRAAPFQCKPLLPLNAAVAALDRGLGSPLPGMLRGLRGGLIALDGASPATAHYEGVALLDGAHLGELATFITALPGHPLGKLTDDGKPIALPLHQLGLPIQTPGHLAVNPTRAALVLGPDSETRAELLLHTTAAAAPPLAFIRYDLPRFRAMMAALDKPLDDMPFEFRTIAIGITVDDDGLRLDGNLTW